MRLPTHIYSCICLQESWVSQINVICSHRQLKPPSDFYAIFCFHANKMNSHFRCELNWVGLSVSDGKIRCLSGSFPLIPLGMEQEELRGKAVWGSWWATIPLFSLILGMVMSHESTIVLAIDWHLSLVKLLQQRTWIPHQGSSLLFLNMVVFKKRKSQL